MLEIDPESFAEIGRRLKAQRERTSNEISDIVAATGLAEALLTDLERGAVDAFELLSIRDFALLALALDTRAGRLLMDLKPDQATQSASGSKPPTLS